MHRILIAAVFGLLASAASADHHAEQSKPYADLQSVAAFDQYLASLEELRDSLLRDAANEREAAEAMRFLLRVVAMAQDVSGDGYMPAPHFARMDTARRKVGGDNPDAEYDHVVWHGDLDYKITGNVGTVDHMSFTVLVREPPGAGRPGRSKALGYVNERTIGADSNGDFTLWLTGEKPDAPGLWIETAPGMGSILVRQYIGDRSAEQLATYQIEVVGRERFDPLPPSSDAEVAQSIHAALQGLRSLATLHHSVTPSITDEPNVFRRLNSDDFGADISSSDNLYMIGTYAISQDEALIVELEPLDVRYWNLAIESPWHESVDYTQRKTSRTHDDVTRDADGKLRFLIAHARTDHPNYLVTAGHSRGFMTLRWVGERETEAPLPKVTRLPLAEAVATARALAGRASSD
jgi:hypothetical protein